MPKAVSAQLKEQLNLKLDLNRKDEPPQAPVVNGHHVPEEAESEAVPENTPSDHPWEVHGRKMVRRQLPQTPSTPASTARPPNAWDPVVEANQRPPSARSRPKSGYSVVCGLNQLIFCTAWKNLHGVCIKYTLEFI